MDAFITAAALRQSLGSAHPPLLIDIRRQPTFLGAGDLIRGALRRDPAAIDHWRQTLPAGRDIVVYCVHGHEVSQNAARALGASSRWITRERPKIDRIACPWEFSHEGERCSFDAFVKAYRLGEPALEELACVVRGADIGRLDLAPQAAGLLAVSLGLSRLYQDGHEMLEQGMVVYDALYAWCKGGKEETHTWNPTAYK